MAYLRSLLGTPRPKDGEADNRDKKYHPEHRYTLLSLSNGDQSHLCATYSGLRKRIGNRVGKYALFRRA